MSRLAKSICTKSGVVVLLFGCSSASDKAISAEEPSPPQSSQEARGGTSPSKEPIRYRGPDCDGRSFGPVSQSPRKRAVRTPRKRGVSPDGRTGAVEGVVSSTEGEPLTGVTAVATSPALSGTQTALTDGGGSFRIGHLPPGTYVVTFYYSDLTERIDGVQVKADGATTLEQSINTSEAGGAVIEIKDRAPTIIYGPAHPCGIGDFSPWPRGFSTPGP